MPERFSASQVGRHMACHASASLELAIPNWTLPVSETAASTAGTLRHAMLEPILALPTADVDGMARVLRYVADLRKTRRFSVLVEQPVVAEWLDSQPTTQADLVLFTQDELHILDQKWGKMPVDVYENEQLMYYAVCYAPLAPKAKGVTVHIMQPHADNFASWWVSGKRLRSFMDEARYHEEQIHSKGDLSFGVSDHCTFCPANPHGRGAHGRPFCPAMMKMLYPTIVDEVEILSI